MSEFALQREMIAVGQELHRQGLIAATDGNLSARLDTKRFLITRSGVALGRLNSRDFSILDHTGRRLAGAERPSSEYRLHLAIYAERADVGAVVHAHPPLANALTFADVGLADPVVPEVVLTLGVIPTTPYATPSTAEGAEVIRRYIREHDAVMLARHGSVTVGRSVDEAFLKLEKVEHTARILVVARLLGRVHPLSGDELERLGALRESLGLGSAEALLRSLGVLGAAPTR
jgi:L-fuculose-phosphate aldolase